MADIVQRYADLVGFGLIEKYNVLVEGVSDAELLRFAAQLYREESGRNLLDKISIIPVGMGSDGGVYNLNKRLLVASEMAGLDCDADGRKKYSFIGLYDNDFAGRRAVQDANRFNRSLVEYLNIFRLRPVMPRMERNDNYRLLARRFSDENRAFDNLDWEVEDVFAEKLGAGFREKYPEHAYCAARVGARRHWEFGREGKRLFRRYVMETASLQDVMEAVAVVCALRSYFGLQPPPVGT